MRIDAGFLSRGTVHCAKPAADALHDRFVPGRWLRSFFVDDIRGKKIPAGLEGQLFRRLQMLDDAMTDADLRVPRSNPFREAARPACRLAFDPR